MRYGYWRDDKPAETGFSPEFISYDTEKFMQRTGANIEDLYGVDGYQKHDTLLKAFRNNSELMGDHKLFGTRFCYEYIW